MSIESQTMFGEDLAHLRNWARLGVRVATITHGEARKAGQTASALQVDPSHFGMISERERSCLLGHTKGLTPFARDALDAMADLGMVLDVAHANDRAFWECLEIYRGPVCYTHGNCYTLFRHSRNLTDDMMKALAERGGVMCLAFVPYFVDETDATVPKLADHFLHALDVMGPDGVGVGSDFDGMRFWCDPIVPSADKLPDLWAELSQRGVSRTTVRKIASANLLRLLG
jgi:membrane dipeptidase